MKKYSRFMRFSLRTFLVVVFCFTGVLAWLTNAQIEHRRELAFVGEIRKASVNSRFVVRELMRDDPPSKGLVLTWSGRAIRVIGDYQGPSWLKNFCKQRGIKIFDRIVEIELEQIPMVKAGLNRDNLRQLRSLTRLKLQTNWFAGVRDVAVKELKEVIPECQLTKMKAKNQIVKGVAYPSSVTATIDTKLSCCATPIKK